MIPIEFKYSDDANYPYSNAFNVKSIEIINQNIVITSDNKDFSVSFQNVFGKYTLPYVESDAIVQMAFKLDAVLAKSIKLCNMVCHNWMRCRIQPSSKRQWHDWFTL